MLNEFDTIFYQGNGASQTQALYYVGSQTITATTGETMWCEGFNGHLPLDVIDNIHLTPEISDVNLSPFGSLYSYLNLVKVLSSTIRLLVHWYTDCHFETSMPSMETVKYHAPNISQMSIGQQTDIDSHYRKYENWLHRSDKKANLVLYGVSRGTAATFCAFAQHKYPEVKLVILEGAIDSVANVISKRAKNFFKFDWLAQQATNRITSALSFFKKHHIMQYDPEGPSPLKSVAAFPQKTPVVFITSKIDRSVPCENTENIAQALAQRGKNDVYLLTLENSSHPCYMFDDKKDRDNYESLIHAIYKKYNLAHKAELADRGQHLLSECQLSVMATSKTHKLCA